MLAAPTSGVMAKDDLMRAMLFDQPGQPLRLADVPKPKPDADQVLIRVHACGVCRTDLHILDGELPPHKRPLIMGHQIVGTIESLGSNVRGHQQGDRVGVILDLFREGIG